MHGIRVHVDRPEAAAAAAAAARLFPTLDVVR